jgi:hypothetical protein
VTASIVLGSVPAVLIGSFLSSRAPDRYIRPIITFVIFASGLKYIGVGTTVLGWTLCAVALGGGCYWLARTRPWANGWLATAQATSGGNGSRPSAGPGPGTGPPAGADSRANGDSRAGGDTRAGADSETSADSRAGPPGSQPAP